VEEPEKLEVETSGKKKKERHPDAHRKPPEMTRYELMAMVGKLQNKVEEQRLIIQEQKKCLKNGGDDGEGGKTYKQLYELRNGEFDNMMQERGRLADNNATLEKEIAILKTAASEASFEKQLFKKDMDAKIAMLAKVEAENETYKNHFFGIQQRSTYGGFASVSHRGPSPAPDH